MHRSGRGAKKGRPKPPCKKSHNPPRFSYPYLIIVITRLSLLSGEETGADS